MWGRKPVAEPIPSPRETVAIVGSIYSDLNDKGLYLKPQSSLPCSWFAARECFMRDYECEYLRLSERLRDSYHFVYKQLALFVRDDLLDRFEESYKVAVTLYCDKEFKQLGRYPSDLWCRGYIAKLDTLELGVNRAEYWKHLGEVVPDCPASHRRRICEMVVFCAGSIRALDEEWVAFANLVAYPWFETKSYAVVAGVCDAQRGGSG
jgi:hypothetical protein